MAMKDNIIKVEIWNRETKHASGVGRAVAGGIIAGGVGAVVCAATKKDKSIVTFKVTYESGNIQFCDAKVGSAMFKAMIEAMQRLESGKPLKRELSKAEKVFVRAGQVLIVVLLAAIIIGIIGAALS